MITTGRAPEARERAVRARAKSGGETVIIADLIAEAVHRSGRRWVGIGIGGDERWVVISRSGTGVWIYSYPDSDMALARFFEHANISPFSGRVPDGVELIVHHPDMFRPPSQEAWRRIGGQHAVDR